MNSTEPAYHLDNMYIFIDKQIQCGICYELVFENVECFNCSSLFCVSCITDLDDYYEELNEQHDESYQLKCPHCRIVAQFYENQFVTKILNHVQMACTYCQQQIERHNFNQHLDNCQGKFITCQKCGIQERSKIHHCQYILCPDCHSLIKKTDKRRHARYCPLRPTVCDLCNELTSFRDKKIHQILDCDKYLLRCDYCYNVFQRGSLRQHLSVCPKIFTLCPLCKTRYKGTHVCKYNVCFICKGAYLKGHLNQHLNSNCKGFNANEKIMKSFIIKKPLPPIINKDH